MSRRGHERFNVGAQVPAVPARGAKAFDSTCALPVAQRLSMDSDEAPSLSGSQSLLAVLSLLKFHGAHLNMAILLSQLRFGVSSAFS